MKEDGLLIYIFLIWIIILVITAPLFIVYGIGWLGIALFYTGVTVATTFLTGLAINISVDRPLKLYSPIPIKLDKWRFVFYVTRGSELISGQDLMMRELLKTVDK